MADEVIAASLVAEWVRRVATHPLDTMTARLQFARKAGGTRSIPLIDDARAIAHMMRSSPSQLYRGLTVSMIGAVPLALVYMPSYELCKNLVYNSPSLAAAFPLPAAQLASVATGILCSCVRVPISVVKARIQVGMSHSARECIQAASAGGWRGLYVGWPAACVLDVSYALVQFTALENFRTMGIRVSGRRQLTAAEDAIVGFITGAVTAVATEPIDVVRLRLQTQQRGAGRVDFGYLGLIDGLRKATTQEGVFSLFRGLLPRLLLKSIGSSIWYAAYQWTRRNLANS